MPQERQQIQCFSWTGVLYGLPCGFGTKPHKTRAPGIFSRAYFRAADATAMAETI